MILSGIIRFLLRSRAFTIQQPDSQVWLVMQNFHLSWLKNPRLPTQNLQTKLVGQKIGNTVNAVIFSKFKGESPPWYLHSYIVYFVYTHTCICETCLSISSFIHLLCITMYLCMCIYIIIYIYCTHWFVYLRYIYDSLCLHEPDHP